MQLSFLSWPWPLPALLAWLAPWLVLLALRQHGAAAGPALAAAGLVGACLSLLAKDRRRRLIAALGFPLSAVLLVGAAAPAWAWLAAAAALVLLYPIRAWGDAPLFPTPLRALQGLRPVIERPPARVLDAGCGLGHGLRALRRIWPHAELHGVELSAPVARWAALRCPFAHVVHGDMWAPSWAGYDLVYLFQRPESMPRAWAKAQAEMKPGSWLASLEFAVPGVAPHAALATGRAGRKLWLYRLPAGPVSSGSTAIRTRR